MQNKLDNLKQSIQNLHNVLVAFSGGVDSTFLLKVCVEVLGKENVIAVTANSGLVPKGEFKEASELARYIGVPHRVIEFNEFEVPDFPNNPSERCYYCKRELFKKMHNLARDEGLYSVIEGSNADDSKDFRPGMRALIELGVKSPLKEAGLTKQEIRILSKQLSLSTWDKPSFACLASRFPYGEKITPEKLKRVGEAEAYLRELGFSQFRVRSHGDLARIEVLPSEIEKFFDIKLRDDVVKKLKQLGFIYICLDLKGYRTGSLNEVLGEEDMAIWKE